MAILYALSQQPLSVYCWVLKQELGGKKKKKMGVEEEHGLISGGYKWSSGAVLP